MAIHIKKALYITLATAMLSAAIPSPAQAGGPVEMIKNFIADIASAFSGRKPDPDPSKSLVAPFATPEDVNAPPAGSSMASPLPVNNVALDRPHRNPNDLAEWLDMAMAETLSFDADTYAKILGLMTNAYTDAAIVDFRGWVEGTGILAALQENGLQINGFVTEKPYLLNQGVVNGSYKWLFEVPVMISFIPRGADTLTGQVQRIESRNLILTLQAGRVAQSKLEHGVMIESWVVRENNRKK